MELIAATYAPLTSNNEINKEIIPEYQNFLADRGVKGAFVNGSTGEFSSLTLSERKHLINAWASLKNKNFKLINHVGHSSLEAAVELTLHSKDKVDGIAAIAPYYYKVKHYEDLLYYCKTIAEQAPDIPFYYYHIPVFSGTEFKMSEFIPRAVESIPNFKGIKYTHGDLIDLRKCMLLIQENKLGLRMYFGYDEMFDTSLSMAAEGWVGSTYNHLSPLYLEIYQLFLKNDLKHAAVLQNKAVRFVEILNQFYGFAGGGKSFMKELGLDFGQSRFPNKSLSQPQMEKARKEIAELGIDRYL